MKLTTILFDLDGTLLPMDNDEFTKKRQKTKKKKKKEKKRKTSGRI